MSDPALPPPLERVSTGIPGLDRLTHGGLLRAGIYLVLGTPGAGKTILSNQVAYHHVKGGGRAVYMTLLSESHSRMLAHVQGFSFFDSSVVGDPLLYVSGYQALEQSNLQGLLTMVRRTIVEQKASLLVIDGVVPTGPVPESELLLKKFIHELKAHVEMTGCTVLLLTSTPAPGTHYPAQTMVDGIFSLSMRRVGLRAVRELEIVKFRGSDMMSGGHVFEITKEGVEVHPRFEALFCDDPPEVPDAGGAVPAFGVPALDRMLGGGVAAGSTTLLFGAPGSGKTLLGLRFLAEGCARGEPCLFVGFYEAPKRLIGKASAACCALDDHVQHQLLEFIWRPSLELFIDRLGEEILAHVRARGIKRVVIDGLEAMTRGIVHADRTPRALAALTNHLRAAGVTTVLTQEAPRRGDTESMLVGDALTAVAENIILLRYAESGGLLHRLVSVLKTRDAHHDVAIREFHLTDQGFELGPPIAHPPSPGDAS